MKVSRFGVSTWVGKTWGHLGVKIWVIYIHILGSKYGQAGKTVLSQLNTYFVRTRNALNDKAGSEVESAKATSPFLK